MNDTAVSATRTTMRDSFYARIDPYNLAPLWERAHSWVTSGPNSPAKPAHWNYDDEVHPFLMQAGGLITAKEATRRVLILENPGLRAPACITQS